MVKFFILEGDNFNGVHIFHFECLDQREKLTHWEQGAENRNGTVSEKITWQLLFFVLFYSPFKMKHILFYSVILS